MLLRAGETGLRMDCAAQAVNIAVVVRVHVREPEPGQRALSHKNPPVGFPGEYRYGLPGIRGKGKEIVGRLVAAHE